jgi:S-adenosylmethionine decarboxylase
MNQVVAGVGLHLLADFYGVAAALLRDASALEALLRAAAGKAGAQVLGSHFHTFGEEDGVTGVVLLSESHISVHTWPEAGFAAIDIFMCGSAVPERALEELARVLRPARRQVTRAPRGQRVEE